MTDDPYDDAPVSGKPRSTATEMRNRPVNCTCAASGHAQRWTDANRASFNLHGRAAVQLACETAFIAGYHTAIRLIRSVLHETPDDLGMITVTDPGDSPS